MYLHSRIALLKDARRPRNETGGFALQNYKETSIRYVIPNVKGDSNCTETSYGQCPRTAPHGQRCTIAMCFPAVAKAYSSNLRRMCFAQALE